MKNMFEVLRIIHEVTPLKGADIVHRAGIGPKGTYHGSKVELQVQWPRGVTESNRDKLVEELRKAKFEVNVDTRPGAGELGTVGFLEKVNETLVI